MLPTSRLYLLLNLLGSLEDPHVSAIAEEYLGSNSLFAPSNYIEDIWSPRPKNFSFHDVRVTIMHHSKVPLQISYDRGYMD